MWDGGTARQIGLVDGFGGMQDAIAKAAELAKLGDERGLRFLEPPKTFRETLLESFAAQDDSDDGSADDAFAMLRRPAAAAARGSDRRSALDPVGADDPGALPGVRSGRGAAAAGPARPELPGDPQGMAGLSRLG